MPDLISAKPTCDKITEKILINKATASIGALCLVMFLRMGGVFIVLPLISVYAGGLVGGGDAFVAGMALGAYGITQAFMQIPAGLLADRWGRKPVMATALLLFAIGGFSAAAAQTVEALILARLLQGVGAVASVASAWLADVSPAEHRTRAMAVFGSAIALAFMISIFTAIPLAGAVGIKGVFVLTGCVGLLAFAITLLTPSPAHSGATVVSFLILRKIIGGDLTVFALGAFALHYALATIFLYLPTALNLALEQHWRVYAPSFLASLLIAVPLIYFADRRPATIMLIACALIPPGLFIIFTFGHWSQWATVGLFLFFSGFIVLEAAIPARVSHAALANRRGLSLGVVMTCQFAGIFAGGAFSGLLIDMFGGPTAAAVAGLLFLGWFAVLLRIGKHISAAN
ncbi:MAG: MFS transporter [Candidatus Zeuxoniibacter abyssi]|nr:MAG: MFS transporter [Candidatus Persebacteraceae bacterium AB1(2)]